MIPAHRVVLAYRLVYGSATVAGLTILAVAQTYSWTPEQDLWLARASGWAAFAALALALAATPVARALHFVRGRRTPAVQVNAYRRAFGVASAWLASMHGAWTFVVYLDASWRAVSYWPYLRAGVTALAILLALLVTSYPKWVRSLRVRLWKHLHRLAYIAAVFVFQHLLLAPFASKRLVFGLFATLVVMEALRFLPARRIHS